MFWNRHENPTAEPEVADEPEDESVGTDEYATSELAISDVAENCLQGLILSGAAATETPQALAKRAYDIAFAFYDETQRRDEG